MRLIKVEAFLERERLIKEGKPVDRRKNILEFGDDEVNEYAILSHRWMEQEEVDYREMVKLAKMAVEERDEIRQRDGYRKILQSCEQAQKDGYEWLWVDTCCIDKRSSAELSEAINSMYRLYENAQVCYAYLHDVPGSSFPTASDWERYADFNGWPEWFSRGWTLQELIAPSNVQFFNKDWQSIGDKGTLAPTLEAITGIPEHILTDGLRGNRPCVAQIMSWAANRTTTRVEDRAYSLMGLLDVNMPMLYGEGKKAFHRLQLEIIRASNDQSIFAWDSEKGQLGSILADDPSDFHRCGRMELMGHDEFIQSLKYIYVPEGDIEDRLGSFPITNRGIQIWMLLRPCYGCLVFQAWLPCRRGPSDPPVTIDLVLWESNYYRCPYTVYPEGPPQLCQVYLRYQDPPHCNTTFEIDDSSLTKNGFTCCDAYPEKFTGNMLTLTSTDPLCIKVYFDGQANHRFSVGFGQWLGKDWIHVSSVESNIIDPPPWEDWNTMDKYLEMLVHTPEYAQPMDMARSGSEGYGQICVMQSCLPQTTRVFQISSIMWSSSRMCGVKLGVFDDPSFCDASGEWTALDVDGTDDPVYDWGGLMTLDRQTKYDNHGIPGVPGNFSPAPAGIELGDYGHFTDSNEFSREGNLIGDLESLSLHADITTIQHKISPMDRVPAWSRTGGRRFPLYKPLMLSLPTNDDLKSLLASFSTRLTNRYLVTRVIHCPPDPDQPGSNITTPLYSVVKPLVWHRNESASSVAEKRSSNESEAETENDQSDESEAETEDDQSDDQATGVNAVYVEILEL